MSAYPIAVALGAYAADGHFPFALATKSTEVQSSCSKRLDRCGCEDFAIAKMELLATLGISRDKIRLIVARDLVRNSYHALLMEELSAH